MEKFCKQGRVNTRALGIIFSSFLLTKVGDLGNWFLLPCELRFWCCNNGLVFQRSLGLIRVATNPGCKKSYWTKLMIVSSVSPTCQALWTGEFRLQDQGTCTRKALLFYFLHENNEVLGHQGVPVDMWWKDLKVLTPNSTLFPL